MRECKKIIDDEVGKEEYMPTDQIAIPIILCVIIILGFLSFGSVLYHFWEGWDFITAAYFCFITMSTIGFGDYVPSNSFLNYETSMYGKFQMVVCTTYIMLGLACLATVLSLIQEGLMLKAERMKNKMGLGKTAKVKLDSVNVRERVYKDASGYFVGLDGADKIDTIETVSETTVSIQLFNRRKYQYIFSRMIQVQDQYLEYLLQGLRFLMRKEKYLDMLKIVKK